MNIELEEEYARFDSRHFCYVTVAILFLAALALRLPSLTLNSFWHDELFTVGFVLAPIRTKRHLLVSDFHPPLFNVMVYFWSLLWGKSEMALRMLSVLFGTVAVPISFLIFKRCFDTFVAFAVAVLILLLPSHIYYSQELRSYSFGFLAAVIATGTLFIYLEKSNKKNRYALAVSCALLFAIHYISIFYILTIYLLAVIGFDHGLRLKWKRALEVGIPTFALMLPNLPHFIYKRITTTSFWPEPITLDEVIHTLLFLFQGDKILSLIFLLSIIIALWYAFFHKYDTLSLKIRALALLSALPLSGVIFVSLLSPNVTVLISRVILIFAPAIILLTAVGISCLPTKTLRFSILILYAALSAWWLYNSSYYTVPTKSDFREVARQISKLETKYGKIILISLDNNKFYRHQYYFEMFGVKSKIFTVSKEMTDDMILDHIRNSVVDSNSSKIVLFSSHLFVHKHVLQICNKHFIKIYEQFFTGFKSKQTFLIVYSFPNLLN